MISTELYLALILIASIAAGMIGAMVGIGGGILIAPMLTLLFGVPVSYAIGTSIISVIGTSCGGCSSFLRNGIANFEIGTVLNAASVSSGVLGSVLAIFLMESGMKWAIYIAFGPILLLCAYDLYRKLRVENRRSKPEIIISPSRLGNALRLKGQYYDPALKQQVQYEATRVPQGISAMMAAGLISGLLGVGAGALNVLSMSSVMRLPFKISSATSNFMIGVTAVASAGIYFLNGYVNLLIAAPVAVGVIAGAFLGAKFLARSNTSSLRLFFIIILVISAIEMLQKGVTMI